MSNEFESGSVWNADLQCRLCDLTQIGDVVIMRTPRTNYPDMQGAIRVATRLFAGVRRINTVVGGEEDTAYKRVGTGWEALP